MNGKQSFVAFAAIILFLLAMWLEFSDTIKKVLNLGSSDTQNLTSLFGEILVGYAGYQFAKTGEGDVGVNLGGGGGGVAGGSNQNENENNNQSEGEPQGDEVPGGTGATELPDVAPVIP